MAWTRIFATKKQVIRDASKAYWGGRRVINVKQEKEEEE